MYKCRERSGDHLTTTQINDHGRFRDNLALVVQMVVFYLNFRVQLDFFSIFYDHHETMVVFSDDPHVHGRQMVAEPPPQCIIYIVTRVF